MENWKQWVLSDLDDLTSVFYSFITLDSRPNADSPRRIGWDGLALYETMTLADVVAVMSEPDNSWNWKWQSDKIKALQEYCSSNGKNFIWAIGGWSDLVETVTDAQIPAFVEQVVSLLALGGAQGIDMDWEHLSAHTGAALTQQRLVVAKTVCALKVRFLELGWTDTLLIYTPRYNAFWRDGAYSTFSLATDGEGLDTFDWLRENCPSGIDTLDYVNYMAYDIAATEGFTNASEDYFVDFIYDAIVDSSVQAGIPLSKIVMGYEPGTQAYTGVWAGMTRDKQTQRDLFDRGIGGIMWWAMNENAGDGAGSTVGKNAVEQAAHVASFLE